MAVVPFTSIVLLPTANTVDAAVTVKSPPIFVEPESVLVAPQISLNDDNQHYLPSEHLLHHKLPWM